MIFELCPGGDLFDRVASKQFLKEKEVMRIVKKMCSALTYLHDRSGDCTCLLTHRAVLAQRWSTGRILPESPQPRCSRACMCTLLGCGLVRRDQTVHFPATSVASLRQSIHTSMHLVIHIARVLTQAYCAPRHQIGELDIRGRR